MTVSDSQAVEDLEWAIGINRLSLNVYGIDDGSNTTKARRIAFSNLRPLICFFTVLVILLIPQTSALIKVWGDLLMMVENLTVAALFFVVEFEFITLWCKNEVITTMMEYIKIDWMRPKSQRERNVMLRYGNLGRIITIGGFLTIIMNVMVYHFPVMFGFVLRTLTNLTDIGDRPFVLQTVYPFDAYRSPIYELVVVSQIVMCTVCGLCYTTVGTLFGAIVLHVSAQLENLYNRIQEMCSDDDTGNFQVEFQFTIEEHERLIRFAKLIEKAFSLMLLEVVTGFTFLVCIQGYQVIVILGDDVQRSRVRIVGNITYMMYLIFIMFAYSAVGDILETQSESIQYATYNCKWFKLKPREAAHFIPMLVRSQRPLTITAGKFVSVTLPTFASLLKTAAGYISFLLAVRD